MEKEVGCYFFVILIPRIWIAGKPGVRDKTQCEKRGGLKEKWRRELGWVEGGRGGSYCSQASSHSMSLSHFWCVQLHTPSP